MYLEKQKTYTFSIIFRQLACANIIFRSQYQKCKLNVMFHICKCVMTCWAQVHIYDIYHVKGLMSMCIHYYTGLLTWLLFINVFKNVSIFSYSTCWKDKMIIVTAKRDSNQAISHFHNYRQTSSIRRIILGNKLVNHSDADWASHVGVLY